MKRKLLITAAVLVILLVAAALVVPRLIDVDGHRPAIQKAIASAIGRDVSLGHLELRILPTPALSAAGITIGEDPAFGSGPFLEADACRVSVRILPLIRGRVAVKSISIESPRVRLVRNAHDAWNVASLAAGPPAPAPGGKAPRVAEAGGAEEAGSPPPSGAGKGQPSGVSLSVDRLSLSGGTLTVVDDALVAGKRLTTQARDIRLTVSDLSTTTPVGVDLGFDLGGAGDVSLSGRVGPPPAAGARPGWPLELRLRLRKVEGKAAAPYVEALTGLRILGGRLDLDLSARGTAPGHLEGGGKATLDGLKADPLTGGGSPVKLSASVALQGSFDGEETHLTRCDVTTGGSAVSLTGSVRGLKGSPVLDAKISTKKVDLADVGSILRLVGSILPAGLASSGKIRLDASVRGPLDRPAGMAVAGKASIEGLEYGDPALREPIKGIQGTIALSGGRAQISGFGASLGKSSVKGSCTISHFDRPVIDVHLTSPLIDLDDLMSLIVPTGAARAAGGGPEGASVVAAVNPDVGARAAWIPASLTPAPAASLLADLTVRGDLSVDRMKLLNLDLRGARGNLGLENGQASLSGVALSLYGGGLKGSVTAGLAENGPPFTLDASLSGVDFNALASDFSPDLKGLVYGTLQTSLNVRGRGLDRTALKRNLQGSGSLALSDGKLTSFGALKLIAKALEAAGGRGIGKDETPFKSLSGSFDIGDGLARTDDLELLSPDIKMSGKGNITLDLGLDLNLSARISKEVSQDMVGKTSALNFLLNKAGKLAIEVHVGGTLMEPKLGVDKEALKKSAREKLEEKGKSLLDKLLKNSKGN